jgi:hypothetical protein
MVDDKELLKLLDSREELKASVSDYRKADKKAKDRIKSMEQPMPFRIGRYIISSKEIAGREVSFEIAESRRINISLADK